MGNKRTLRTCEIYFIGNAGVLISADDTSVLIDGLYSSRGGEFPVSPIPGDVLNELYSRRGPLPEPDYLVFSHPHYDHLSEKLLDSYLDTHPSGSVYLPEGTSSAYVRSLYNMKQRGNTYEIITGKERQYRPGKDLEISFYKTRHLGKNFKQTLHYCILITISSCRLLFTADVDFFSESLSQFSQVPLNAAFVNPFLYHNEEGQKILRNTLQAEHTYIYHVPFEDNDNYHIRHMINKDLYRYRKTTPAVLLCTPRQNEKLTLKEGEQTYDVLYRKSQQ